MKFFLNWNMFLRNTMSSERSPLITPLSLSREIWLMVMDLLSRNSQTSFTTSSSLNTRWVLPAIVRLVWSGLTWSVWTCLKIEIFSWSIILKRVIFSQLQLATSHNALVQCRGKSFFPCALQCKTETKLHHYNNSKVRLLFSLLEWWWWWLIISCEKQL